MINIPKILQRGEGISVEFKRAKNKIPKNLFETVCAFLNRNGGVILLGVEDNGVVEGVEPTAIEQMKKDIVNLCNDNNTLSPPFLLDINDEDYSGKKLISIYVPADSQVHTTNNKIFDRNEDGDYELRSAEQKQNIYIRKSNYYSENLVYPFLYESDFVPGLVERVRRIIRLNVPDHPWNEMTDQNFFRNAGLYRRDMLTGNEGFTMAALLLFGNDATITSAIPHYKVDALVRRRNLDRYDDRIDIRCNLVEAYDKLMEFVHKHLPDKFYLEGIQRMSIRDKIFREVVTNILIHREYTNAYTTSFVIERDKAIFKNANRPHNYGELRPNSFEPFAKNPHISQIFRLMGRAEEAGSGVRNVFKYSQAYSGSENIKFVEEDIFVTEIPLDGDSQIILPDDFEGVIVDKNGNVIERKSKTDLKTDLKIDRIDAFIVDEIIKNDKITIPQIAEKIGRGITVTKDRIAKLKELKIIDRVGSLKGGYWKIIENK